MSKLAVRRPKPSERRFLDEKLADRTLSAYVLDRYRIVDALLRGYNPSEVARFLGCERPTVYQWVYSFNESSFSDFEKASNPYGRPAILTSENLRQLVKIALSRPQDLGLPFTIWSVAKLSDYCRSRGLLPDVSNERKTVRDLLTAFRRLRRAYPRRVRLYVIMDNLPLHKTEVLIKHFRMNEITPVWTPTYSSWLNLIECRFTPAKRFTLNVSDDPDHQTRRRRIYRYMRWRNRQVGSQHYMLAKVFNH